MAEESGKFSSLDLNNQVVKLPLVPLKGPTKRENFLMRVEDSDEEETSKFIDEEIKEDLES
jgi:hypothetical protein